MDIQSSSRDLATPLSYKNLSFCRTEDSGYHTSFTSPSLECSALSNDVSLDPSLIFPNYYEIQVDCYPLTPNADALPVLDARYNRTNASGGNSENTCLSKRGIKRAYEENVPPNEICYTVATPTTFIANEVQKLKVNDTKLNSTTTSCDSSNLDLIFNGIQYPTTPIKKVCRTSCHLSPFNHYKSARNLDFATHSLSCETQVIKLQPKPQSKVATFNPFDTSITFGHKPNQKVDIIKMLFSHEGYCSSSIRKILSYLSHEDIYNFTLVSSSWLSIFKSTNTTRNYNNFFKNVKSNLENWDHVETPKSNHHLNPLKEIQNVNLVVSTPRSPKRSPRSNRFNKYTKAASLDNRSQTSCVNCRHPAKVTIEASGEEWADCTCSSCAYQFCRLCKCERHPGKSCMQYDLVDGPSPSKRKKNVCPISSIKSKKKLKRLLF